MVLKLNVRAPRHHPAITPHQITSVGTCAPTVGAPSSHRAKAGAFTKRGARSAKKEINVVALGWLGKGLEREVGDKGRRSVGCTVTDLHSLLGRELVEGRRPDAGGCGTGGGAGR